MVTHEYIAVRSFNSSFKNTLRDYYTYGFKSKEEFKNYDNNYGRLNNLLQDYMKWSDSKENVIFATCDSQSMDSNPFHRVYRFCGAGKAEYLSTLFHTLAALDRTFKIASWDNMDDESWEKFSKSVQQTLNSMEMEKDVISALLTSRNTDELLATAKKRKLTNERIELIQRIFRDALKYSDKKITLKTSDLVKYWFQNLGMQAEGKKQDTLNKNANNRLDKLRAVGVIQCRQRDIGYTFTEEQIESFFKAIPNDVAEHLKSNEMLSKVEEALKNYASNKSGDRNWYLSGLTVGRIIKEGSKKSSSFEKHLQRALDFYSKTFLFGEIGMFLQDRIGNDYVSPFRIKHEYYMHSLNDFNAIDLMAAIENKEWCLISYKRDNISAQVLCYPIELRISSTTGREYLMYYEPLRKSCSSLRLEFIESIVYYHDKFVKKCLADYYSDDDIEIGIERNLNRAKLLMDYTWGVSTGVDQEKNVEELNHIFKEVFLRISYNSNTDYYILNRLYRESRIGMIVVNEEEKYIDFSVVVADVCEVIPFIRSFYSRVLKCSGYDKEVFSIEQDIRDFVGQELTQNENNAVEETWHVDEEFLQKLGKGINANEHEKLFNEIFCVYYRVFAAIFGKICYENKLYTKKEIMALATETIKKFRDEFGAEVLWKAYAKDSVFFEALEKGGFLVPCFENNEKKYRSRYYTLSEVNIYRDCLPLSEVEIRWLKTIVEDGKIHYFLNEKEILALKLILADFAIDIKPFFMHAVNYYDRYKFSEKKEWKESSVLNPILDAIAKKHVIKITYMSNGENLRTQDYHPIVIEYSKRDNRFVGYFLSCKRKEGLKEYPLAQIVSVEEAFEDGSGKNKTFDMNEAKKKFEEYKAKQQTSVELEFSDKLNLADRILTEFSPWDKRCEFDSESGIYHLTIFYPKKDGKDMVIRLLAYGSDIRFVDQNHVLAKVVQSKLRDQRECMQKQVVEPVHNKERSDDER